MFDFPALDVVIGLVFIYLLLSLVCASIDEGISAILRLRARFLQRGLLNLFSASSNTTDEGKDALKRFYMHPLIQTFVRPQPDLDERAVRTAAVELPKWWHKPVYPAYLPSRTVVAALTDLARDTAEWQKSASETEKTAAEKRIEAASKTLEKEIASIPNEKLSNALLALYRSAEREGREFHDAAEQWFDVRATRVPR